MHTDVIKVLFKSQIPARILNKVNFIQICLLTNHKHHVLIGYRLIMKPSSNIIWTCMYAWIRLHFRIPWISQKYMCHKLPFQQISELFGYLDLCLNHSSLLRFYFREVIYVWLCQFLLSSLEIERDLRHIELALPRTHTDLGGSRRTSHTQGRGVSHGEKDTRDLARGKGAETLELTDFNGVGDFKGAWGKSHG